MNNEDNIESDSKSINWNNGTGLINRGQVRCSGVTQLIVNEDVNCHKSKDELNREEGQEMESSPMLIKGENADENQLKLCQKYDFEEKSVVEFYIKNEEIEIKTEPADNSVSKSINWNNETGLINGCQIRCPGLNQPIVHEDMNCRKNSDDLDNADENQLKLSEKYDFEENSVGEFYIKNEEIEIKSEDADIRVDSIESDQSGNCNSFTNNASVKRKRKETNTKIYKCSHCSYSTMIKSNFNRHQLGHKNPGEVQMHKCNECKFETKYKHSLTKHIMMHLVKKFKCVKCPYHCKRMEQLKQHMLIHERLCRVYATESNQSGDGNSFKNNASMKRKDVIYKCNRCSYSTVYRQNFKRHQLTHKNPGEIQKYKCEKCRYVTNYKENLTKHMVMHDDPSVANKFKCAKCPYDCKRTEQLKKHMVIHERPYRCKECSYSSAFKHKLFMHEFIHQKDTETQMYKCKMCSFQTEFTVTLWSHVITSHTTL